VPVRNTDIETVMGRKGH